MADGNLVELTLALLECKLDAEPETDQIYDIILAVEDDFAEQTDRVVAQQVITEYLDVVGYTTQLFLKGFPVATSPIPQLWNDPDWAYAGDDLLVLDTDYTVDYDDGIVKVPQFDLFEAGPKAIKITYTAGYLLADFPARAKRILARQVSHWWWQLDKHRKHMKREGMRSGGLAEYVGDYLPSYEKLVASWMR